MQSHQNHNDTAWALIEFRQLVRRRNLRSLMPQIKVFLSPSDPDLLAHHQRQGCN
jgi:hypothetical protein